MTRAVCIKCGNEKHGAWTPCQGCGYQPFGVPDLAWSLVFSDQTLTHEGLDDLGKFMAEHKRLPKVSPDIEDAYRYRVEAIKGAARGLVKKGLLPLEEAPEAATPLVGEAVTIALAPKVREAIEDFCLDQTPPAKPDAVLEWIVEDWLTREGYID